MKRQIILSHNMKKGAVTKNQLLTKEMRSRHQIKVVTKKLLKGQKSVVVTMMNIAGNKNDVATWN